MAGGQWRMNVPAANAPAAANPGGAGSGAIQYALAPFSIAAFNALYNAQMVGQPIGSVNDPSNLLGIDGPSLLTIWELESIYLPVVATAGAVGGGNMSVTLQLLLNGTLVWQARQTAVASQHINTRFGNAFVFSDDFINPITVKRSDQLALGGSISNDVDFAVGSLGVNIGAQLAPLGVANQNLPISSPGAIGYQVIEIPGRRRL